MVWGPGTAKTESQARKESAWTVTTLELTGLLPNTFALFLAVLCLPWVRTSFHLFPWIHPVIYLPVLLLNRQSFTQAHTLSFRASLTLIPFWNWIGVLEFCSFPTGDGALICRSTPSPIVGGDRCVRKVTESRKLPPSSFPASVSHASCFFPFPAASLWEQKKKPGFLRVVVHNQGSGH